MDDFPDVSRTQEPIYLPISTNASYGDILPWFQSGAVLSDPNNSPFNRVAQFSPRFVGSFIVAYNDSIVTTPPHSTFECKVPTLEEIFQGRRELLNAINIAI